MQPTVRSLQRIHSDERGSVAVVFALMTMAMLMFVGAAVDTGRWLHARTTTIAAIDKAVLAAGRSLQVNPDDESAALTMAQRFYRENVLERLPINNDTVAFFVGDNRTSVSAKGNAYIETHFMAIAGIESLPLLDFAEAKFSKAKLQVGGNGGSNIEIALVLDVTGSMCDDRSGPCTTSVKLDGLKTAAKDLLNIVIASNQTTNTSKASIVPFATRIRVGQDYGDMTRVKQLTNLDSTWAGWYKRCIDSSGSGGSSEEWGNWVCNQYQNQHVMSWYVLPCVTDRFYNDTWSYDYTDDAPGPGKWLNGHDGGRMTLSWDSSDIAPTDQTGLGNADPATHWNFDEWSYCGDEANQNEVMPLSSDKAALEAKIDGLQAYGATAGALGTSFGWYTLSPKWSSIWTGDSTPAPYSDLTATNSSGSPKLRKIAVIMTDGVYNTYRGWKEQDQKTVSDYAVEVCKRMQAEGIEIYTVGFALNELTADERTIAEETLIACGTDVQHFYSTLTVSELQQAFRDIALKLSSLYLSR